MRIAGHDAAASNVPSVDEVDDDCGCNRCLTIILGVGNTTRGMHSVASVTFTYKRGAWRYPPGEGREDDGWEVMPVR